MRVAVLAALPRELAPLVRQLRAVREAGCQLYDIYLGEDSFSHIILVATGMGTLNAISAVTHVRNEYRPDIVVSIGYGGSLFTGSAGGDIVFGSEFLSIAESGAVTDRMILFDEEVFKKINIGLQIKKGAIITLPGLMKKSWIISKLPAGITNPVCDMETCALAVYCADNGIRFFAMRGITDLVNQDITSDVANIADETGKVSIARAIQTILKKPWLIPVLIRLGIYSHKASQHLRDATISLLEALR
jgi:adenosylhomocysteine nucleosidase